MASSTLLVLSLRSPLLPIPLANSRWGRRVTRREPKCAVRRRNVCTTSTRSFVTGSDTEETYTRTLSGKRVMDQSFTFIDPAGNQAQYTVYDVDRHNEYHWSTDHGDRGVDGSYGQAQNRARAALKSSMAARRQAGQRHP